MGRLTLSLICANHSTNIRTAQHLLYSASISIGLYLENPVSYAEDSHDMKAEAAYDTNMPER